jgi:RHS repeat-associated protein
LNVSYNPATNRQTGDCADANGNLNSYPACANGNYYDVENRITRNSGTLAWAYSYGPGNKRIWRGVWSGSTQTVDEVTYWGATGQKLVTYQLSLSVNQLVATATGTDQYFGGKLVKNATGYVTPDRLGSIGKYFPYGQERPSATQDGKEKFATYFRDSETGLDYAVNRYEQPGMGRFMTPDPYGGSASSNNPGSWNRYAYAGGDPINNLDPDGLDFGMIFGPYPPFLDLPDGFMGIYSTTCSVGINVMMNPFIYGGVCPPIFQGGGYEETSTEKTLTKKQQRDVDWLPGAQDYLKTFDTTNQDCLTDLAALGLSVDAVRNMDYTLTAASGPAKSYYDTHGIVFYTDADTKTILYDSQNFYQNSFKQLLGTLLHEFSHLGGLEDPDVAALLGLKLKTDPVTGRLITNPISKKFQKDCFSGVKNP